MVYFTSEQMVYQLFFFFSSRRRHTRYWRDWSSDVCSSDLGEWLAPHGTIGRKVGTGDVPMAARHLGGDELRSTSGVEAARTGGSDPPQRRFELALAERRIARERAEVSEEVGAPVEFDGEVVTLLGQHALDAKALMRIAQRGREIRAPGEAAEAVM